MESYDLVVIGAGPGGATAAKAAALKGLSVALVDDHNLMGYGLEGAYKSKALYEIAREQHIMSCRWGVHPQHVAFDFGTVHRSYTRSADALRQVHRREFEAMGITLIEARGRFVEAHTVAVGDRQVWGEAVLIATGTTPRSFPSFAVDGERIITSDHILHRRSVPASLVVLGAGVIGCEFASIFAALGTHVTLLDSRPRILSHDDEDIGALLQRSFEHLGVQIFADVRCESMATVNDEVVTSLRDGRRIASEVALVAVGRSASTGGLGLEVAGVATNAQGYIPVNDHMQTNVSHIYAVGDVGLRDSDLDLSLVHVAEAEARAAVAHLTGEAKGMDTRHVPFIVFTLPMIAGAGHSERAARAKYGDVRVGKFANRRNHRACAQGSRSGFIKLVVGPEGDDRVLGMRAVGDGVDTVVGEASMMIENNLSFETLLDAIHAHPSLSESLHGAAQIIAHGAHPYTEGEEACRDYVADPTAAEQR